MVFDSFLDFADEHGLPFRSWAEALEEKGIPSFVLLLIPILVLGAAAFVLLSQAPSTGTVKIYAQSQDGQVLEGVSVSLVGPNGFKKEVATNAGGLAAFSDVPAGTIRVQAFSSQVVLKEPAFDVVVKAGQVATGTVFSEVSTRQSVVLTVDVRNAAEATIRVFDSKDGLVDMASGVTSNPFAVAPENTYRVVAESDGFLPAEQDVTVARDAVFVELILQEKDKPTQSQVHVNVFQQGLEEVPVENASVRIVSGDQVLAVRESSQDGSIVPVGVPLGANVTVLVSKEGFAEGVRNFNASRLEEVVVVELQKGVAATAGVTIRVRDSAGNPVFSPIVRLFEKGLLKEDVFASDGVAQFDVSSLSDLSAEVYKSGFLPKRVESLQRDNAVVLERASANNSGRVRVLVLDRNGLEVSGAAVQLLSEGQKPLGIPPRLSGTDGEQVFDDVPLGLAVAQAVLGPRVAQSSPVLVVPLNQSNETRATVQFEPVAVDVPVRVTDKFSSSPIRGAKVVVADGSCTTAADGACLLKSLESDDAVLSATANGFESFESAAFSVYPGMQVVPVELVSASVARDVKLSFDGVFDSAGRKVNFLDPVTSYEARYTIFQPNVSFSKAEAFISIQGGAVLLGGQSQKARVTKGGQNDFQEQFASQEVAITPEGLFPATVDVPAGGQVVFSNEDNATHVLAFDDGQSLSLNPGDKRSLAFNAVGSFGFKSLRSETLSGFVTVTEQAVFEVDDASSVLFEYPSFNGSKQLTVRFKTSREGDVVLSHRSAFFTPVEALRDPLEGVKQSGSLSIRFQGTCAENLCVQHYFEFGGRTHRELELPLGEPAELVFNVVGLEKPGEIRLDASPGLVLLSGRTETSSLQIRSNESSTIRIPAGRSEVRIQFEARRLAEDASIGFAVASDNAVLFEGDAFLHVFAKTQPALVVSVRPSKVLALEQSAVTFSVKDGFGEPVSDALVVLGDAEANPSSQVGQYVVESLQPESLQPVSFEVRKEGFKVFRGSLSVEAPDFVLEVSPSLVSLSVDSREKQSAPVQVTNLLGDALRLAVSVNVESGGELTDVDVSTSSLRLKGHESGSFDVLASLKEEVMQVARRSGALTEDVRGIVRIRSTAKGFSDAQEVRFQVQATQSQQSLDDVWLLSPDSLSYSLEPPRTKAESQEVTVSNNGPYPLVFNVEQTLGGLSVQPASLVIPSNQEDVFTVRASTPNELNCFSDDVQRQGAMTVYASFQGITSKKTAQINVDVLTSSLVCAPPNGYRVTLPVDARMMFQSVVKTKVNPDGSTAVLLPGGQLMWFESGASVTPVEAQVPPSTGFMLDRSLVQPLPEGGWTVRFPVQVVLSIPDDADRQPFGGGQTIITIENAQIILPPGVQSALPQLTRQASNEVVIPPLSPVTFRRVPFNYDAYANLLPADSVEVHLPADAVLDLPAGTVERKLPKQASTYDYLSSRQSTENLYNIKAIQLPGGERLAFGDQAAILINPSSLQNNPSQVRLPADAALFVSRHRVAQVENRDVSEAFTLTMPVPYSLTVQGEPVPFQTEGGLWGLKVNEKATVEASWKPSVTKTSSQNVVRVVRENSLTYLSGASARIPVDPASLAKCSFSYEHEQSVSFLIPQGASLSKKAGRYEVVLPRCDETSKLTFHVSDSALGTADVLETPAIRKITFPDSAEVLGDLSASEEKQVTVKGTIEFVACLKDEQGKDVTETLKTMRVGFNEKSLVSVPERAILGLSKDQREMDFEVLTPVTLKPEGVTSTSLGSTKKMTMERQGRPVTFVGPPDYDRTGIVMEPGSELLFVPVCQKGTGRLDITATAEDVVVREKDKTEKAPLEVTFSNKNFKKSESRELVLINSGTQAVNLDGVSSEADASLDQRYRTYLTSILRTDTDHAFLQSPGVFGQKQKLRLEGRAPSEEPRQHVFVVKLELPDDMVIQNQCIKSEFDGVAMNGAYVFSLTDLNGDAISESQNHRMPVIVRFDAKAEDCQLIKDQEQFQDLATFSVNYDAEELAKLGDFNPEGLFYKNTGHYRYFAVINNEENPIELSKISGDGAGLVSCQILDSSGQVLAGLQVGHRINPGDVRIVKCTSVKPGAGSMILDFSGAAFARTKTVHVEVFQPDSSVSKLYQASPIGQVFPFFSPKDSSLAEKAKVLQQAGSEKLEFAEQQPLLGQASPTPTSIPSPSPAPQTDEEKKKQKEELAAAIQNVRDFRFCKSYFCTFSRGQEALYSFADAFQKIVKQKTDGEGGAPTIQSLSKFCDSLQGLSTYRKSMVLQLANVQLTGDESSSAVSSLRNEIQAQVFGGDVSTVEIKASDGSDVLFKGCGIYQVEAVLNPMCGSGAATPEAWKKSMRVEFRVNKIVSCEENLANAALLTAQDDGGMSAYTGNQLGHGVVNAIRSAFSRKTFSALAAIPQAAFNDKSESRLKDVLESVGRVRQGVLGQYGVETNEKDEATVKALYHALYNVNVQEKKVKLCPRLGSGLAYTACPAKPYEDAGFCWRTGFGAYSTILGTSVALFAAQTAYVASGAGGAVAPLAWSRAIASNYRLISAYSGCLAGAGAEVFQGRSAASCRALDVCTGSVLSGIVETGMPFFGNWRLLRPQIQAAQASSQLSAGSSAVASFFLEGLLGAGVLAGLEEAAGLQEAPPVPAMPVTFIVRQFASPTALERELGATRRFVFNMAPYAQVRGSPAHRRAQVELLNRQLEAQGIYNRRASADAIRALYDAGGGDVRGAFQNSRLVRALAAMDDGQVNHLRDLLEAGGPGPVQEQEILNYLAESFIDSNPQNAVYTRNQIIQGLGLTTPDATGRHARLAEFIRDLPFSSQHNLFTRPGLNSYFTRTQLSSEASLRTALAGNDARLFGRDAPFARQLLTELTSEGSDALLPLPRSARASPWFFGVRPIDLMDLESRIPFHDPAAPTNRFTAVQYNTFLNALGVPPGAAPRDVATSIYTEFQRGRIQLTQIDQALAAAGQDPLPNGFGGLRSLLHRDLRTLQGPSFQGLDDGVERFRRLFQMHQVNDITGAHTSIRPTQFADLTPDELKAARQLLEAERHMRIFRGVSFVTAFLTSFLFNTDFRPVQVEVDAGRDGHVIALHAEDGKYTAESICVKGIAGSTSLDCKPPASNVLSPQQLCGSSPLCMRLLKWSNGKVTSYALVVGFNDAAPTDPEYLNSLFIPKEKPVNKPYMTSARVQFDPISAAGFSQYQADVTDPKTATRTAQIEVAKAIISDMNDQNSRAAFPADKRDAVKKLAQDAINAFKLEHDTTGSALLAKAQQAETALRAGTTEGR
ncbi:hypothetical protein HY572_04260 [Candidatus Micrarchaeota archaeon]|nr:hypothetical protein [Candidatus Micrarchaeota archaeon]